jgi:hypothetical protein
MLIRNKKISRRITVKRTKIILLVSALLIVFIGIGISGCLQQKESGQLYPTIPVASVENNSPVVSPTVTTPETENVVLSEQSGVTMFRNPDSICIGQSLTFGLTNNGNNTIRFGVENPYWIQFYDNGTWGNIFNGGGFQAGWALLPGMEIKRGWDFTNNSDNGLNEWYNKSEPTRDFYIRSGLYRIMFLGRDANTNEKFTVGKEFTIREC